MKVIVFFCGCKSVGCICDDFGFFILLLIEDCIKVIIICICVNNKWFFIIWIGYNWWIS